MKLLLDTCTFLWIASGSRELSKTAKSAFLDTGNDRYLSASSAWEIATKYSIGRMPLPKSPDLYIGKIRELSAIDSLPINEESAIYAGQLPRSHSDPFDRILVAQAIIHGMVLLTPDPEIRKYPARVLW